MVCIGHWVCWMGHWVCWTGQMVTSAVPLGHWVGLVAIGHCVGSALHVVIVPGAIVAPQSG